MSELEKDCRSHFAHLLKSYNRDYDYHEHLRSITQSLESFPCLNKKRGGGDVGSQDAFP